MLQKKTSRDKLEVFCFYIRIRYAARAMDASSRFRAGVCFFLYISLRLCYS